MPAPKGRAEFRYFLDVELKEAAMRKCEEQGTSLTWVLTRFLKEWTADIPTPALNGKSDAKPRRKR